MQDNTQEKHRSSIEDLIKELPFIVWFCGIFAYLFVMIVVSTSIGGFVSILAYVVMVIPMGWATWIRMK